MKMESRIQKNAHLIAEVCLVIIGIGGLTYNGIQIGDLRRERLDEQKKYEVTNRPYVAILTQSGPILYTYGTDTVFFPIKNLGKNAATGLKVFVFRTDKFGKKIPLIPDPGFNEIGTLYPEEEINLNIPTANIPTGSTFYIYLQYKFGDSDICYEYHYPLKQVGENQFQAQGRDEFEKIGCDPVYQEP